MRWKNVENDILIGFNYMRASIFNDARNGKMMDSINIRNCFIFTCTLWYFFHICRYLVCRSGFNEPVVQRGRQTIVCPSANQGSFILVEVSNLLGVLYQIFPAIFLYPPLTPTSLIPHNYR